jgi:hypothetical protein
MDVKIARLRTHRKNIDRYEVLLNTQLTDAERQFVEKRLSEERLAIAALWFMGLAPIARHDLTEAPELDRIEVVRGSRT